MRYLSKIVFINSADKSLKYADIDLDGNVHFIGTQGVGKSTLLRAILFFYNADTRKLGIPREKKNYNEYYFPYQNSYIVYEVQTETGPFCVLSFKSQGRVAFRFFDSDFDQKYFIDHEGKAFVSWDKTREAFGKDIGYTRIVNSYEEYRNILYGNNRGLSSEFRKYALLESKQYQNIPRTIANVFLNAKLDAEFVKETIIKSLNEEEVKIDLTTYSKTHLRDFETNLNDIKKWTDRDPKGENQVENQAEKVSTTYSALRYLEQKIKELAFQLGYALDRVHELQPSVREQRHLEELKRDKLEEKLNDLDQVFENKKGDIQKQIGEVSSKIKDISTRKNQYTALKIEHVLERVARKPTLELEKNNLTEEKDVLTSQYLEIKQRYEAQLRQLENQIGAFENKKDTEKNDANSRFLEFKEDLNKRYDSMEDEIRDQHKKELETAHAAVKTKEKAITDNRIKRSETKHKRFYASEIESNKSEIVAVQSAISSAEKEIQQASDKVKTLRREWELEERGVKEDIERKIERKAEEQDVINKEIVSIDAKIKNSKDSLYGWLNDHIPDWEHTIGKVIDEENVLFRQGLNPQKMPEAGSGFYGIHIDTEQIAKNVKTVADLQDDQQHFETKIQKIQQAIAQLNTKRNNEQEKLKRKFKPKIKAEKELIQRGEYTKTNSQAKLDEERVRLSELESKAQSEQKAALENIDNAFWQLSEEKTKAEEYVQKIEAGIARSLANRRREKRKKIKEEQHRLDEIIKQIEVAIREEWQRVHEKIDAVKTSQKNELDTKGADTVRIDEIDLRLSEITGELTYIENNRDTVAEYNKDKRELFDKESEFKNKRKLLNQQIATEEEKHKQQKTRLVEQLGVYRAEIDAINEKLTIFEKDLEAFQKFSKTEVYQTVEPFISSFSDEHGTDHTCVHLINELHTTDNTITKRYLALREAINTFTGNFQENNIFRFKVKFTDRAAYFEFAEMLKEFVDENKITEYKKREEERFAHIIRQIGRETNALIEKEGEISKVINDINNDFVARNFVGAVKSMELKTDKSASPIFQLLVEIKNFNDENIFSIGMPDLFSSTGSGPANKNEKAISLLKQLIKEMATSGEKEITLSDSFELLFRIVENDNDTGWVEKLTNVGSDGTDVLVKAMINIMLLNVFKEKAAKKQKDDFRLHCMMDEIGKLHPTNVKGILKFANDRNILLINSSPTSLNATDYRYTYLLSRDKRNITNVRRLVKKITSSKIQASAK